MHDIFSPYFFSARIFFRYLPNPPLKNLMVRLLVVVRCIYKHLRFAYVTLRLNFRQDNITTFKMNRAIGIVI